MIVPGLNIAGSMIFGLLIVRLMVFGWTVFRCVVIGKRFDETDLSCSQKPFQCREVLDRAAVLSLKRIEQLKQFSKFLTN